MRARHRLAALVPLLLAGLLGCGSEDSSPSPGAGWSSAPQSPLSARHSALAVTVGDEVLVLGGDATPLCGVGSGCIPQWLRDGAAFAPGTGKWRRLADAPVAPSTGSLAGLGTVVYLLTPGRFHAYDPSKDTWTELPAPPDTDGLLVSAGNRLLRLEPTQENGVQPDHLYDPGSGTWRALPRDPLAPTFDRGAVWTGRHLVLLGKPCPPPPVDGVDQEPTTLHTAAFDPGAWTWTTPPKQGKVLGFGTFYTWTGSRVLVPYTFDYTAGGTNPGGATEPTGGLLDHTSGQWERLPEPAPRPSQQVQVEAAARDLVTAGEGLVLDIPGRRWHVLAPSDGGPTVERAAGAWVGRQLVVFGGGSVTEVGSSLSAETRVWTAPE